jgi:hypothetical protein
MEFHKHTAMIIWMLENWFHAPGPENGYLLVYGLPNSSIYIQIKNWTRKNDAVW